MSANRRKDKSPIPDNYLRLLNEDQKIALRNLESFGIQLAFIRNPGLRTQEAMVIQPDGKSLAQLDEHGELHDDSSLRQRDDGKTQPLESIVKVGREPIPSSGNNDKTPSDQRNKPKTKFIV